ncbi:hypothetical protein ACFLZ9_01070 [Patescibacteria group bacterium]
MKKLRKGILNPCKSTEIFVLTHKDEEISFSGIDASFDLGLLASVEGKGDQNEECPKDRSVGYGGFDSCVYNHWLY